MAGARKDSRLGSRSARVALKARHQPYWINIAEGIALGYRRGPQGGSWYVRAYTGKGQYQQAQIGSADDYIDANGETVLTFYQAQEKARKLAQSHDRELGIGLSLDLTVAEAAEKYLAWYKDHRRAYTETEHSVRVHILPALGTTRAGELTSAAIRRWLEQLAAKPARVRSKKQAKQASYRATPKTADEKRARKSTANRVFNILKAMLNRAYQDGLVANDSAWRKVKPFAKVDEARIRFLTDAEALRLVNACPTDLRQLVRAALLTGARFGELANLRATDVNLDTAQVYFSPAKSGRSRYVPLNDEGVALLKSMVAGKTGDQVLFVKTSGEPWGKNHHVRSLQEACKIAKVKPAISFHELRHTYASHLAQSGIDLLTISKLLGHADTRITSKHYAHLADKTLAAAVTKLPSFGTTEPAIVLSIR